MRKLICIILVVGICFISFAQQPVSSPQGDSLYQELKKKPISEMTEREYEYFIMMRKLELGLLKPDSISNTYDLSIHSDTTLKREMWEEEKKSATIATAVILFIVVAAIGYKIYQNDNSD